MSANAVRWGLLPCHFSIGASDPTMAAIVNFKRPLSLTGLRRPTHTPPSRPKKKFAPDSGRGKGGLSLETAEQRYKGTTRLFLVVHTWCRRSCPTA
jgi:hypothetical protein